jgi:hypothetical protein
MVQCANKKQNDSMCTCTYTGCSRHGVCCECLHYHRQNGELPACYFDAKTERTYDRSIENFINMKRG